MCAAGRRREIFSEFVVKIGLKSPKSDLKVLNIIMLKEKRTAGAKFLGYHLKTHKIYILHSILGEGGQMILCPPPFFGLGGDMAPAPLLATPLASSRSKLARWTGR